ncbi:hypothetical protein KBD69_05300 [Candidatus Woesebacteria bacterium]|nr:hypothetical protein [Candidatus Woesebacteria bacterium]
MTKHSETAYVKRDGMPQSYQKLVVDRLLRKIGPPNPDKRVVDAHAGRGAVGFYIADHGYPVTLLDYNPIAFNNDTHSRADSRGVEIINKKVAEFALERPGSIYALHAKDPWDGRAGTDNDYIIGCLGTFMDMLEPDGHLLVASYHLWGYLKTYLLVKQMGFKNVNVSSWTPSQAEVENDWYKDSEAVKRYVLSCTKKS